MKCPYCHQEISQSQIAGEIGRHTSRAKRAAAKANGKRGGRPSRDLCGVPRSLLKDFAQWSGGFRPDECTPEQLKQYLSENDELRECLP